MRIRIGKYLRVIRSITFFQELLKLIQKNFSELFAFVCCSIFNEHLLLKPAAIPRFSLGTVPLSHSLPPWGQLDYYIKFIYPCQYLFASFFIFFIYL